MVRFTSGMVDELNDSIHTAEDAIRWASDTLHPDVGMASSFGAEDSVLMDMMIRINPDFRFFTLDTGRLPQATHDIIDVARKRYHMRLDVTFPDAVQVQAMVNEKGQNLFYDSVENRQLCCHIRKVEPMNQILSGLDGWITGMRSEQTTSRHDTRMFELDTGHDDIIKINPIIDWSWAEVWGYIKKYDIPYNALLDQGYPSIGCEPCTRAIRDGEDYRAGRWWWEHGIKECGLHTHTNDNRDR